MGGYSDRLSKDEVCNWFNTFDDIIYIIACVLSLGLVYVIRIIIARGVSKPLDYIAVITKDIEIEVGKIKEEVGKIKSEIECIKRDS